MVHRMVRLQCDQIICARISDHEKTFKDRGSGFVKEKKEYFMSLDWDLIWTMLQVVALLIIAREIDKRIRKRNEK